MKKRIRVVLLHTLKGSGVFERVRDSRWRRRQLLILCYHSLAIEDENLWRPAQFITPSRLRERFEMLKQGGYQVLHLGEGLQRLRSNDLAARSVVLTFDDGTYDFHKLVFPLLKEYGFPATVYQSTHYCSRQIPIFPLICSYMLWKKRNAFLGAVPSLGIERDVQLIAPEVCESVARQISAVADREQLSTEQKNGLAAELARKLGLDYEELLRQRILQLMTPKEIAELAAGGVSFQLHTHRHRAPRDRALFEKEIQDNRDVIEGITRSRPVHFCYPNGDYDAMFLPWLTGKGIASATTCDPGLASLRSEPLLLPRFIDTTGQTAFEFESWLTGVGAMLSTGSNAAGLRKLARLKCGDSPS